MFDTDDVLHLLKSDCLKCNGLCCKDLYCFKQDGFPQDKVAGIACCHLQKDNRCIIHSDLSKHGYYGCIRYDCFGAGQHLTSLAKDSALHEISFDKMLQMHQMLLYLWEAYHYILVEEQKQKILALGILWKKATQTLPSFQAFDIDTYRQNVNQILRDMIQQITKKHQTTNIQSKQLMGKDFTNIPLHGADFTFAYLMAADLSHLDLHDTIFLGSDVRDMKVYGSDLSHAHFLTQMQINAMQGDSSTKIPFHLQHPSHWPKKNR